MPDTQRRSAIEKKSAFSFQSSPSLTQGNGTSQQSSVVPSELSLGKDRQPSPPPVPFDSTEPIIRKKKGKRTSRSLSDRSSLERRRSASISLVSPQAFDAGALNHGASDTDDSDSEESDIEQAPPQQILQNGTDAASIANILKSIQYIHT